MPTYNFKRKSTGEEFTEFLFMSEVEAYLSNNPDVEQQVNGYTGIGDPYRMGMKKPDSGFRDVLKQINKNNRGAKVNTF